MTPLSPKIKEYWARYTAWQRDPMHILSTAKETAAPTLKQHRCANCYTLFDSENCPNCGQKHNVGRITWASIWQGIMDLWGLGTSSLPYTLWQLIWRPGYLIGDYISGRRQMSFPPVKMLVFVALFTHLVINWIDPASSSTDTTGAPIEFDSFIDYIEEEFSRHYDLAALVICSFFILPTYLIFRDAPRCTRHTLPEGFFIQIFNAVVMLMWLGALYILSTCYEAVFDESYVLFYLAMSAIIFNEYRIYLQLFGYGYWATLWRFVMVLLTALLLMFIFYLSTYCVFLALDGHWSRLANRILTLFIPFVSLIIGILAFCRWINVRTHHQSHEEPSEDNLPTIDGIS